MRVYFTCEAPCLLRLGGAIAGSCSRHEKFADIPEDGKVLAEFFPEDAALAPLSFLLDKNFFDSPPAFSDVYRYDCGANVHVKRLFPRRQGGLRPVAQLREGDTLATLYEDGGLQLCLEGDGFYAAPLPFCVRSASLKTVRAANATLIAAEGKLANGDIFLSLFAGTAPLFSGEVVSCEGGEHLKTVRAFHDHAGHIAESVWAYRDGQLHLENYAVREREGFAAATLDERLIPFAFFEAVLARGAFRKYLSPALLPRAEEIRSYLGGFTGVCVPPSVFYLAHGKINAAGLVYPEKENLFRIKFFAAPLENGKISNIVPAGE